MGIANNLLTGFESVRRVRAEIWAAGQLPGNGVESSEEAGQEAEGDPQ